MKPKIIKDKERELKKTARTMTPEQRLIAFYRLSKLWGEFICAKRKKPFTRF